MLLLLPLLLLLLLLLLPLAMVVAVAVVLLLRQMIQLLTFHKRMASTCPAMARFQGRMHTSMLIFQ